MTRTQYRPRPALPTLLALTVLVLYQPVYNAGFLDLDDNEYVTANPAVLRGLTLRGLVWAFTSVGYAANWHPLTWVSHMLDVQIFGLAPFWHHLGNVLLQAATAALLFLALRGYTGARWPSAFVAAVFALHPLQVENVAWVAERKGALSSLFWVIVLGAYLRQVRSPGVARSALTLFAFACGLMTKPMLVTLPFVLLLLDFWPLGRWSGTGTAGGNPRRSAARRSVAGRLLREKAPFFLLSAASCAITIAAQRLGAAVVGLDGLPPGVRLANALGAYASYLGMMLWPADLAVYYPYGAGEPRWLPAAGSACLLLAVSLAVWLARTRAPCLAVGWLWYLGTLVPVIGLVQVGNQGLADRYAPVPLMGICLAVSWGAAGLWRRTRRPAFLPATLAVVVALAAAARAQAGYWVDDYRLMGHALAVSRNNWFAENNFGVSLLRDGRPLEALSHFGRSIEINSGFKNARNNLAIALLAVGRVEDAVREAREALRLDPRYALARGTLGSGLARLGRTQEALEQYREAIRLGPDNADLHNNLGAALGAGGQPDAARLSFEEALRLNPDHADAHFNLAALLEASGRRHEARAHFRAAARLRPADQAARAALARLAGTEPGDPGR